MSCNELVHLGEMLEVENPLFTELSLCGNIIGTNKFGNSNLNRFLSSLGKK